METQCPNCQTVFELADEDLNRADGKVRCGECTTVFDGRSHLTTLSADGSQDDDPAFAETGVGWVLLPADQAVPDGDKDDAQYLSSADDEGWQKVGRPQDAAASNTDADELLRFDDNSPLPEDNLRLAETMAHETTSVVFKIVDSKPVEPEDEDPAQTTEKEPPGDSDSTQDTDPKTGTDAGADENDDWAVLLAEIDDSTEPTDRDETPATASTSADDNTGADNSTADEDDVTKADDAAKNGLAADSETASAITARERDSTESAPDDEAAEQPPTTEPGETADAEIDAGLLAVLGGSGSDSDAESAGDFFDDVLAELPDRSSVDMPTVSMDDVPDAESDDGDDVDEEVDSSGIFVQENVLPDEDELADVVPNAEAEASIVESIDNEHFIDTGASDVADTPGWLSETQEDPDPLTTSRQKVAVAALIAFGVLQFAHFERNNLATKPALSNAYQKIYGEALIPDWDISNICFEQRDALAENSRMRVVARFVNRGDQAQPYPLLHVTLTGRFGNGEGNQALGHAIVEPADYLRDDTAAKWVGPDMRFEAQVEFPDEQQQTSGYDLEVCYQGPEQTLICNGKC